MIIHCSYAPNSNVEQPKLIPDRPRLCHVLNATILTTLNSSSLLTSLVCKQRGGAEITKKKPQKKCRQESRTEHDGHCVDFGVEGAPSFPRFGPGVDVKHLFLSRGKKKEIREFEDSLIWWDTRSGDPRPPANKSAGTCGTNVPLDLVAYVSSDISRFKRAPTGV